VTNADNPTFTDHRAMLTAYLVRHGQTAFNAEGRIQGWLDVPLDDVGQIQAECLARRFSEQSVQAIYSSPLVRAADTARVIAQACRLELVLDERLREYHMGDWTGLTAEEIRMAMPTTPLDDLEATIPNGESAQHMRERVAAFLRDLIARHDGEAVVLVSHGGTLGAMVGAMLGLPVMRRHPFAFGNASLTEADYERGRWRLRSLNDRCHLQG
jgi:broad specificity phosphatase PhoE